MEAEKPAVKMERRGPEALSDDELLAVLFGSSVARDARTDSPKMKALLEYARREKPSPRALCDSARSVAGMIPASVRTAKKEHFVVLCLDARRGLIHMETVSIGTLSASLVHPREVFNPAIVHSSAAIVAVHNHPSGDPTPSAEDRDVTRRLQRAGELLGIPLADHVVVSESGFFSFREHGLL